MTRGDYGGELVNLYLTHGTRGCDAYGSQGRLVFQDYVQEGITGVIHLTANAVYHCPCSGVTAWPVRNRHQVACTLF